MGIHARRNGPDTKNVTRPCARVWWWSRRLRVLPCVCVASLGSRARVSRSVGVEIWEPVGEYLELNHGTYESSSMIAKAL